jgi:DNA-directed RNA polymerase specialized sigma24 family protein
MAEKLRPLIEAAQAGDRRALDALAGCVDSFVRVFHGSLSHEVRRSSGSTIDFVLEGLSDALGRLESFQYRSDQEFYAWVTQFIRHRILAASRNARRKKRAPRPFPLDSHASHIESPGPTASEAAAADEVRALVGKALVELQVDHALEMKVVLLKVFEGRSWPEIQGLLGLSSQKRARTLFAKGLDLVRPRIEQALGPQLFEGFLGQ